MPTSISKLSSSVSTSIELRDRIEKVTPGCLARNGVVRRGVMASAVGIAAMRTWPASPWRAARISSRMVRASPTMRRAHSSTRWPSGVSPWKREPRCTSMTPSVLLELLDAGRQRRLRHAAFLRGPAEMLLPGERDEKFQLVDHGSIRTWQTLEDVQRVEATT